MCCLSALDGYTIAPENYVGEILTITNVLEVVVSKNEFWKKFQEICRVQNETNLNAER